MAKKKSFPCFLAFVLIFTILTSSFSMTASAFHAPSFGVRIDTPPPRIKQKKLIILGASGVAQIAGLRNDSETDAPQNIHYGKFTKGKDLFFIAKGGTGISWLLPSTSRQEILNTSLFSKTYDRNLPWAGDYLQNFLNSEPPYRTHFSVALVIEGNDLAKAQSRSQLNFQARVYADYYISLAKRNPHTDFYVFSKSAYDPATAKAALNKHCRIFNRKLKRLLAKSSLKNLKFKNFYRFTKNLYHTDPKSGSNRDRHPNQYTSQQMYNEIIRSIS